MTKMTIVLKGVKQYRKIHNIDAKRDIVKKSYKYEKEFEKQWRELLERVEKHGEK